MNNPVRRPPMPTVNRSSFGSKPASGAGLSQSFAARNQARLMEAAKKRRAFGRASVGADQPVKAALKQRGDMLGRQIGRLQQKQKQVG
jgi:hypothetical protein